MMKDNLSHIDKVFQDAFHHAQFDGMDEQWDAVYASVRNHKKRRIIALWLKWVTSALAVGLLLFLGWYYIGQSPDKTPAIRQEQPRETPGNGHTTTPVFAKTESSGSESTGNKRSLSKQDLASRESMSTTTSRMITHNVKRRHTVGNTHREPAISYHPIPKKVAVSQQITGHSTNRNTERINTLIPGVESLDFDVQAVSYSEKNLPSVIAQTPDFTPVPEILHHHSFPRWESYQIYSLVNSIGMPQVGGIAGLRGGVGISYYLTPHFFLSSSLAISYKHSNTGFNTVVSQTSYGLSKHISYYGIEAKHLQYLHIPLLFGMKWQKHRIMVGAGLNYYLGAFGRIAEINREGQPVEEIGTGWISRNYANDLIPEFNLYYSYHLKRMIFGVSLHYTVKPSYPESPILAGQRRDNLALGLDVIYPLYNLFKGKL